MSLCTPCAISRIHRAPVSAVLSLILIILLSSKRAYLGEWRNVRAEIRKTVFAMYNRNTHTTIIWGNTSSSGYDNGRRACEMIINENRTMIDTPFRIRCASNDVCGRVIVRLRRGRIKIALWQNKCFIASTSCKRTSLFVVSITSCLAYECTPLCVRDFCDVSVCQTAAITVNNFAQRLARANRNSFSARHGTKDCVSRSLVFVPRQSLNARQWCADPTLFHTIRMELIHKELYLNYSPYYRSLSQGSQKYNSQLSSL